MLRRWSVSLALALATSAAHALGWFGQTVTGTVVDPTGGAPLKGAQVAVLFHGHYSGLLHGGYYTCYHVAATQISADGKFRIDGPSKPWRMDSDGLGWAPFVHVPGYQSAELRNAARIELVPARGKVSERMRHLVLLADGVTRCPNANESAKNALALLQSVRAEAATLASTPYEGYLLRRIEAMVSAVAQGSEVRSPFPGYPTVIGALGGGGYAPGPGDESLRRALAAPQAEPDERSTTDDTALMIAAWHGRPDLIELLLRAGADPNLTGTEQKHTALLRAVGGAITFGGEEARRADYVKAVELLAAASVCPRIRDVHGRGPDEIAAGKGGLNRPRPDLMAAVARGCAR